MNLPASQVSDLSLPVLFCPVACPESVCGEPVEWVELLAVQGKPADVGGYYLPDDTKASAALRPSQTFNAILASI